MAGYYDNLLALNVEVAKGDTWLARQKVNRVDILKLDTETTEPSVLAGLSDTLHRDRPTIFCEVLPDCGVEPKLEAVVDSLAYRYFILTPSGPVARDAIRGHVTHRNWLFLPVEQIP
jgi:Methyltransferase FkbM domain